MESLDSEESFSSDHPESSSDGRVQEKSILDHDLIHAAMQTAKYSDLIDFAPFALEAIQKLKETDPSLGDPAASQRLWKKFREAYLLHKTQEPDNCMEPFSTQFITKHMRKEVENQNRPRTTLESIAGMIKHVTTQINIFSNISSKVT